MKFERRTRETETNDEWVTGENLFPKNHERWAHKVDAGTRESLDSKSDGKKITLERMPFPATGAYMGKIWRNPVTARLSLKKVSTQNNFQLIDLYTRSRVSGTPSELAKDPYLYKPVILSLRTWMYHDFFRQKKLVASADENGMVKWVLDLPCVDAPINAGQKSSVLYYMPMALMSSFTKDAATVASTLLALIALGLLSAMCNSAQLYSRQRIYGLPVRILHLTVLIFTVMQSTMDTMALVGYIITFMFVAMDVFDGDLRMLTSYSFCSEKGQEPGEVRAALLILLLDSRRSSSSLHRHQPSLRATLVSMLVEEACPAHKAIRVKEERKVASPVGKAMQRGVDQATRIRNREHDSVPFAVGRQSLTSASASFVVHP